MDVFVTRRLPGDALERVRGVARTHVWTGDEPPPPDELQSAVRGADGLLCLLTDRVDASLIAAAPGLCVISQMAVGVDNIDLAAATRRGIPVGHTPGVLTDATADLTWALILAAARRLPSAEAALREGRWRTWSPTGHLGLELNGATIGIVGMGAIGQAVGRRALAFGMDVLYASPSDKGLDWARRVPLRDLLGIADVVTLHTPLTSETRRMIAHAELARMKPSAVLVNTARGGIVDEDALAQALWEGAIAGAGLDVFDEEPLPLDSPLLEAPNLVLAPHIGSATRATRERMASMAVDNLLAGLAGEPLPHLANPDVRRRTEGGA